VREVEIGVDVADLRGQRLVRVDAVFELLAFLQDRLGLFLVLPEIGGGRFLFDFG
jgi:hypothetical protein